MDILRALRRARYKEPLRVLEPEAATAGASAYIHEADAAKPVAKCPAGALWTRANQHSPLGMGVHLGLGSRVTWRRAERSAG
jgi:hypothetical protein